MRREGALQGWQVILYNCQWLIPSCRLEQENTQVQAMLGAANVENGRAKDQLAAVKAKLKLGIRLLLAFSKSDSTAVILISQVLIGLLEL